MMIVLGSIIGLVLFDLAGLVSLLQTMMSLNIWIVLPVGGLLVGLGVGVIQMFTCYVFDHEVRKIDILAACLCAGLIYVSMDAARYAVQSITITKAEGVLAPGRYAIHDLVSFPEYMSILLAHSEYRYRASYFTIFNLERTGTTLYYILNLLGTALGAWLCILGFLDKYPYCYQCRRYFKKEEDIKGYLTTKNEVTEVYSTARGFVRSRDLDGLRLLLKTHNYQGKGTSWRIRVKAFHCKKCEAVTLALLVETYDNTSWSELRPLRYTVE